MTRGELFSKYGIEYRGSRTSGDVKVKCPKCSASRKNKSDKPLSLNLDRMIWNCHNCGFSGPPKRGDLAEKKVYTTPPEVRATPTDKMYQFFSQRGISKAVVDRNEIVLAEKVKGLDRAVVFPYKENGIVVNRKYRSPRKEFRQETNAKPILWKIDDIKESNYAIIVEGEMDALAWEEAGYKEALSVPAGGVKEGQSVSTKMEFLDNSYEYLEHLDVVYICTDKDDPGYGMQQELIRRIGPERCKIIDLPEGCKDANEVLTKFAGHTPSGIELLKDCYTNAKDAPIKGIGFIDDLTDGVEHIYHHGPPEGRTTGLGVDVDQILKVWNCFAVVTGIPSHGKSNVIDQVAIHQMVKYDRRFAYYTPENYPPEVHLIQLLEKALGKSIVPQQDNRHRASFEEVQEGFKFMRDHVYYMLDNEEGDNTGEYLREQAKILVRKFGVNDVVLDPWTEISMPPMADETKAIGSELSKWKQFRRVNDIMLWVIAHPVKGKKEKNEMGKSEHPKPTLYDIYGSSHWYNKADIGIVVHRDFEANTTIFDVQKVKFRWQGRIDHKLLEYDVINSRYVPIGVPHTYESILPKHDNYLDKEGKPTDDWLDGVQENFYQTESPF